MSKLKLSQTQKRNSKTGKLPSENLRTLNINQDVKGVTGRILDPKTEFTERKDFRTIVIKKK